MSDFNRNDPLGFGTSLIADAIQQLQAVPQQRGAVVREQQRFEEQRQQQLSDQARAERNQRMNALLQAKAYTTPGSEMDRAIDQQLQALRGQSALTGQDALTALDQADPTNVVGRAGRVVREAELAREDQVDAREHGQAQELERLSGQLAQDLTTLNATHNLKAIEAEGAVRQALQDAQNDFLAGEGTLERALRLRMQENGFGFEGGEAAAERQLRQWLKGQDIALERERLGIDESRSARQSIIESINLLGPEDTEELQAIRQYAEGAGLHTPDLMAVRSAMESRHGKLVEVTLATLDAELEQVQSTTALNEVRERRESFAAQRDKIEAGNADLTSAADFLINTVEMGKLGVPTIDKMIAVLESNDASSPYYQHAKTLGMDKLNAARQRALVVGEDKESMEQLARQEVRAQFVLTGEAAIDSLAGVYSPEQLEAIATAQEGDPNYDRVLTQLLANPETLTAAMGRANLRESLERLQLAEPRINYAMGRLDQFAQQRPDDIAAGEQAVRDSLQTLVSVGLFGADDDPEATEAEINRVVSFYRQAWGDQEKAFNAELAELASRGVLNRARAKAAEQEGTGDNVLERLKFQSEQIQRLIDGVKIKAHGRCKLDENSRFFGEDPMCARWQGEIEGYQDSYVDLLNATGYFTPDQRKVIEASEAFDEEIRAKHPDWTDEQVNAEIDARLNRLFGDFGGGGEEPEPEPEPTPQRRPDQFNELLQEAGGLYERTTGTTRPERQEPTPPPSPGMPFQNVALPPTEKQAEISADPLFDTLLSRYGRSANVAQVEVLAERHGVEPRAIVNMMFQASGGAR
jgi:hypothetical protein